MRLFCLAALVLVGCAKPDVVPAASRTTDGERSGGAPVTLTWNQVELAQGAATVTLEIQKHAPLEKDLAVELVVPQGVSIEPSALAWTIAAANVGTSMRTIHLRWAELPTNDVIAVADSQGQASGIHATASYRFGRPAPVSPTPATGSPAQLGNHPIGNPIDLSKP